MLRVFIGVDRREFVASSVLAYSIMRNSSVPVSITPLYRPNLAFFTRPRGEYDSTDFAITRFLVPYLSGYEGYSLFLDCDMLVLGDVAELACYMTLASRWTKAAHVVKHDYRPAGEKKFLGQVQTTYPGGRKNWSSVVIFNNALCRALTPEYVAEAPGLDLHQFKWLRDDQIGALPLAWNYLVGEANQCRPEVARLIHFTQGTPSFPEYAECEFADLWRVYRSEAESCG